MFTKHAIVWRHATAYCLNRYGDFSKILLIMWWAICFQRKPLYLSIKTNLANGSELVTSNKRTKHSHSNVVLARFGLHCLRLTLPSFLSTLIQPCDQTMQVLCKMQLWHLLRLQGDFNILLWTSLLWQHEKLKCWWKEWMCNYLQTTWV